MTVKLSSIAKYVLIPFQLVSLLTFERQTEAYKPICWCMSLLIWLQVVEFNDSTSMKGLGTISQLAYSHYWRVSWMLSISSLTTIIMAASNYIDRFQKTPKKHQTVVIIKTYKFTLSLLAVYFAIPVSYLPTCIHILTSDFTQFIRLIISLLFILCCFMLLVGCYIVSQKFIVNKLSLQVQTYQSNAIQISNILSFKKPVLNKCTDSVLKKQINDTLITLMRKLFHVFPSMAILGAIWIGCRSNLEARKSPPLIIEVIGAAIVGVYIMELGRFWGVKQGIWEEKGSNNMTQRLSINGESHQAQKTRKEDKWKYQIGSYPLLYEFMAQFNSVREPNLWYTHQFLLIGIYLPVISANQYGNNHQQWSHRYLIGPILLISDALAAIVGKKWGHHRIVNNNQNQDQNNDVSSQSNPINTNELKQNRQNTLRFSESHYLYRLIGNKTYEGSLAYFLSCFLLAYLLQLSYFGCLLATIAEMVSADADNVVMVMGYMLGEWIRCQVMG